uniref:Dihydroflavonol 4-reducatase 2 n=1 Tax=Glycine max TaxID=3847 RepID=W8VND8_SOYBN|nr:dihydroflavonol 4-reducatase 2 [Glycine max]
MGSSSASESVALQEPLVSSGHGLS